MKCFTTVNDIANISDLIKESLEIKKNPYAHVNLGKNKVLGLIFFNSSLRTRLSTQKAALNLGMNVIVMNIGSDGWVLEHQDGAIMNGDTVEHIKDAASMMGLYCDVIGVRCFPTLVNREEDYREKVLSKFVEYSKVPLINMESATLHPLQSLADMITISEFKKTEKPKVVLTWVPHVKALPQAVANSFSEWALKSEYDLTITHPKGYELCENFTKGAVIEYNQEKALKEADFVYAKNWSSYSDYGKVIGGNEDWTLNSQMMKITNNAKVMHCLPVRRNLEISDELLDGTNSLISAQAENRTYAAQAILKRILEENF